MRPFEEIPTYRWIAVVVIVESSMRPMNTPNHRRELGEGEKWSRTIPQGLRERGPAQRRGGGKGALKTEVHRT